MYDYKTQRKNIFTEEGQLMLLAVLDNVQRLLRTAGAFQASKAWEGVSGDSWDMIACLDRLVELKRIRCVTPASCAAQNQVYTAY